MTPKVSYDAIAELLDRTSKPRKTSYKRLKKALAGPSESRKVSYDAIARNAEATGGMPFETFLTRVLDRYTKKPCQETRDCIHCRAHVILCFHTIAWTTVLDHASDDAIKRMQNSCMVVARNPMAYGSVSFDDFMTRVLDHYTREPCVKPKECMHCAACMITGIKAIVEHPDDCPECAAIETKRRETEAKKA